MKTVHVDLGSRAYDIKIGHDLAAGESLVRNDGNRALIVSDANVDALYGDKCEKKFQSFGFDVSRAVVPAGEGSKDLRYVRELYDKALAAGLDRGSYIIALGGGVVGDLAGFVAATFMRGVKLIQVPSSLLAMVDSSVGGKTGVNLPHGKNLVGVFYQPIEVLVDLTLLRTLPEREYISGLAEVVKYGVIWDAEFFKSLEKNADKLLKRDAELLETVIARCCEIKAEVVSMDERESGVRAVLNFGHTLGHALENTLGYGKWLHGEAVSVGMAFAAHVSMDEKKLSVDEAGRLISLLRRLGLPVGMSDLSKASYGKAECPWNEVRQAMSVDKKARHSELRFVLAERLGSVIFGCNVKEETLEKVFRAFPG